MEPRSKQLASADGEMLPPAALKYRHLQTILAGVPLAATLIATGVFVKIDWIGFIVLWVLLPLCILSMMLDITLVNRLQHRAYRYSYDRA